MVRVWFRVSVDLRVSEGQAEVTASARVMISARGRYLHRAGGEASTLFLTLPLTRHPEPTPTPTPNANANPNPNQAQVRSASRLGFLDLGVNAKRLNYLAAKLRAKGWAAPSISPDTHPVYFSYTQNRT